MKNLILLAIGCVVVQFSGCAEGPLWRIGGYFPWVQAKWAADEQIAETVHAKKKKLRDLASRAQQLSEMEKEQAVTQLGQLVQNEKIIQLRVDALYALGELNTQSAEELIKFGLKDSEAEVRMAAVAALAKRQTQTAGFELLRVLNSDTDKDVRAAVIKRLATYPGNATVEALAQVLNEPEPALQYVAMQTLDEVTGSNIGINVTEWKKRLAQGTSATPTVR